MAFPQSHKVKHHPQRPLVIITHKSGDVLSDYFVYTVWYNISMARNNKKNELYVKLHREDEIVCKNCYLCEKCHDKFDLEKEPKSKCPKFLPKFKDS